MAYHHHHQHHTTATSSCSCCCQPPPCHHYPPAPPPAQPVLTADPYQVAAIVSHILQTQTRTPLNPNDFYSQALKPTKISQNQRHSHHQTDQFQHAQSGFLSLIQRIDALEAALQRFSCSSSGSSRSIRDVAARTIQTHFRAYLVRRSRALGQLKELASIKSAIVSLKASFSRRGFVDLDFLSSRAMELLLHVDSIQGDDQMVRDSKRSITNEIAQFLDLLDGVCVKRHQVVTKKRRNMRFLRDDSRTAHEHVREISDRGVGSKCQNLSNEEKKLLENLKGKVERIGRLSRELENEEEDVREGYEHVGGHEDGNNNVGYSSSHRIGHGGSAKKHVLNPSGKKQVSFSEDGNVVRIYDIDENASREVNEVEEDSAKGVLDEDESWNQVDRSL